MATLFEPTASPRVYGLPPGVDFPKALLKGLRERLHGQPSETVARIHLVVNRRRMKRRLAQLLHSTTPCLLPAIEQPSNHGNVPHQALCCPRDPWPRVFDWATPCWSSAQLRTRLW